MFNTFLIGVLHSRNKEKGKRNKGFIVIFSCLCFSGPAKKYCLSILILSLLNDFYQCLFIYSFVLKRNYPACFLFCFKWEHHLRERIFFYQLRQLCVHLEFIRTWPAGEMFRNEQSQEAFPFTEGVNVHSH